MLLLNLLEHFLMRLRLFELQFQVLHYSQAIQQVFLEYRCSTNKISPNLQVKVLVET